MNPNGFLVVSGWYTAALSFSPPQKHSTNMTNRKISLKNLPKNLNMQKINCFLFFWGPYSNFKMIFFLRSQSKRKHQNFEQKKQKKNQPRCADQNLGRCPSLRSLFTSGIFHETKSMTSKLRGHHPVVAKLLVFLDRNLGFCGWRMFFFFKTKKHWKKWVLKGCVVFFLIGVISFSPSIRHWLGVQKWFWQSIFWCWFFGGFSASLHAESWMDSQKTTDALFLYHTQDAIVASEDL